MRLDDASRFERLILTDGTEHCGNWALVRAVGNLGHAGTLFAQDELTGCVVPLSSIRILVPAGSLTPAENAAMDFTK